MIPALTIAGSLALLVAVLALTSHLVIRFRLPPETARKLIHVSLGAYCLAVPAFVKELWEVAAICGSALGLLVYVRTRKDRTGGLGRGLHGIARDSYGELLFALAIVLLFYLKKDQIIAYELPLSILTLCDAAAALVGLRYGRLLYRIEDGHKSWEGTTIFFLTAWIIAMVELLLMTDTARLNVVLLGILVATYGTLIEATSWNGWDNLFVPLVLSLLLIHHLESPPWLLLLGAGVSTGGVLVLWALEPVLGYDRHVGYVVAGVLMTIGIASTTWNIVLPSAVFLCHLWAERGRPCSREYPHLTACLSMILTALFWYLVADIWSLHTVYSYNVSFAALGAGLLWLCRDKWVVSVAGTVCLGILVHAEVLNRHSYTPMTPSAFDLTMLAMTGVAAMAVIFPNWILRDRYPRLVLPALAAGLLLLGPGQP